MQRLLLVKTSSLGDVVHNLPVVTDIRRACPGITIDWAVEEGFAAIPALHPGVAAVVPVALRRWRRSLLAAGTRHEIGALRQRLAAAGYAAVIDTQGLLKSALLCLLAPGRRHGLDWASSREPLRAFYHRTYAVPWDRHAVERNRALAAQVLGYSLDQPADYGIVAPGPQVAPPWAGALGTHWTVLLHATSAARKLWPAAHWQWLGCRLAQAGLRPVLPWGSPAEQARAQALAAAIPGALVPPALDLRQAAWLLGHARLVAGVDTGLTHLAAALGTPTVGIYGATDPAATGVHAARRARNLGSPASFPAAAAVLEAARELMA